MLLLTYNDMVVRGIMMVKFDSQEYYQAETASMLPAQVIIPRKECVHALESLTDQASSADGRTPQFFPVGMMIMMMTMMMTEAVNPSYPYCVMSAMLFLDPYPF